MTSFRNSGARESSSPFQRLLRLVLKIFCFRSCFQAGGVEYANARQGEIVRLFGIQKKPPGAHGSVQGAQSSGGLRRLHRSTWRQAIVCIMRRVACTYLPAASMAFFHEPMMASYSAAAFSGSVASTLMLERLGSLVSLETSMSERVGRRKLCTSSAS